MNLDPSKLLALSSEWNPFPVLQQMNSNKGMGSPSGIAPGEWDWMKGERVPMPGEVPIGTPTPGPATPPSIPQMPTGMTPQQLQVVQGLMPQPPQQKTMPPVSPVNTTRQIQMTPIQAGGSARQPMGLAEILSGRR